MEILRGAPALSEFRVHKLLQSCAQRGVEIASVYAEYVHFAELTSPLSPPSERPWASFCATARPSRNTPQRSAVPRYPRPGTISPWSSKATDIAHNCGLKQVKRLERGIAYYVQAKGELSVPSVARSRPCCTIA